MKTPKITRFTVQINEARYGSGDLPGFLDMLRYEGGRVVGWTRAGEGYEVTIEVETVRFQPDRWASFMIYAKVVE